MDQNQKLEIVKEFIEELQKEDPAVSKASRMRHTIYLSPDVSKQLKLEALETGDEMSQIVEKALRKFLEW